MTAALGENVLLLIADHDSDGSIDSDVVTSALDRASSFMAGFLSAYAIDPGDIPEALERACYDIAAQQIRLGRDQGTDDSKLAYDNAISWLKLIANGTVTLDAPTAEDDGVIDAGDPQVIAETRLWSRSTMGGVF